MEKTIVLKQAALTKAADALIRKADRQWRFYQSKPGPLRIAEWDSACELAPIGRRLLALKSGESVNVTMESPAKYAAANCVNALATDILIDSPAGGHLQREGREIQSLGTALRAVGSGRSVTITAR